MDWKKPPTSENGDPDQRVGRILNDLLDRQKRGEAGTEARLRAEHPEFSDQLLAHLRVLADLKEPHDPIELLVARGTLQESRDPECGAELGPYRITGFLGQGGMGTVLKAREDRPSRTIALKLLRTELAHDTIALRRFAREARAAGGLPGTID
jgi:serine/threonine protein kinase